MKRIFVIITLVLSDFYAGIAQSYAPTADVKTPMGNTVPSAYIHSGYDVSYTSSELAAYEAELKVLYGSSVQLLGAPTFKYNCHGYAWHISDGGSHTVRIDWPGHYQYWQDGSYAKVFGATDITAPNGARVVYDPNGYGDHSAVKISTGTYVSKWGAMGLVQHPPNACPSNYNAFNAKDFYVKTLPSGVPGFDFIIHNTTQMCLSNMTVEFRAKVGNNAIAKLIDRDPYGTICGNQSLIGGPYDTGYPISSPPGTPITNMEVTFIANYSSSGYATARASIDGGGFWSYSSSKIVNSGSDIFVFNLNVSVNVPCASRRILEIHIY